MSAVAILINGPNGMRTLRKSRKSCASTRCVTRARPKNRTPPYIKPATQANNSTVQHIRVTPEHIHAANYAFDVTPARLVSGLITEYGIFSASSEGLQQLRDNHL